MHTLDTKYPEFLTFPFSMIFIMVMLYDYEYEKVKKVTVHIPFNSQVHTESGHL